MFCVELSGEAAQACNEWPSHQLEIPSGSGVSRRSLTRTQQPACLVHSEPPQQDGLLLSNPEPEAILGRDLPSHVTVDHNYCTRREVKRAAHRTSGRAENLVLGKIWQPHRAGSRGRVEVNEAVDLEVNFQEEVSSESAAQPSGIHACHASSDTKAQNDVTDTSYNAATIPRCQSPRPESRLGASKGKQQAGGNQSLLIHGLQPKDYQQIFRMVVEKALTKTASRPARRCNLELARQIKERLYQAVNCPTFKEVIHPDGRVEILECYNTSGRKRAPPNFDIDVSDEPCSSEEYLERVTLSD
ncbi:uncharacterized protein LOC102345808 [Latimeria chalumnae]|uniref:uncharacterized protein LOC102345808 n=1 Tax=Latimeria chalumnae TaxID=7897 RepID=UPI0003C188A5